MFRLINTVGEDPDSIIFKNPERNLLAAVLSRAILDASGHTGGVTKEEMADAKRWLLSDDLSVFGSAWIAKTLGIEHGAISQLARVPITRERRKFFL